MHHVYVCAMYLCVLMKVGTDEYRHECKSYLYFAQSKPVKY